jgi:hypothetical protein
LAIRDDACAKRRSVVAWAQALGLAGEPPNLNAASVSVLTRAKSDPAFRSQYGEQILSLVSLRRYIEKNFEVAI